MERCLIKTPKLYFLDCGLVAFLLGINSPRELRNYPLKGELFETFVVSEILKHRFNSGKRNNLFYLRDKTGNEVDIILDYGSRIFPIEVKSAETFNKNFIKGLTFIKNLAKTDIKEMGIIYGGKLDQRRGDITVVGFREIPRLLKKQMTD